MMKRKGLCVSAVALFLFLSLAVFGAGATETIQSGFIVVGVVPVAQFDAHNAFSTVPTKVMFVDNSLGSTPMNGEWDFGDGTTSTGKNPLHQYKTPGSFTVTLTVSNANGQDSTSRSAFITTTRAPVADFKADRQSGKAPFVVHFTDLSKGDPTTWLWDFGDDTGSDEQNPSHISMEEGAHNVRLMVTNQHGSDSVFMTDTSSSTMTTAPAETQAEVVTSAAAQQEVPRVPATLAPVTPKSPVSPFVTVLASLTGLLLIAVGKRK
jgi:PKD repeat protein